MDLWCNCMDDDSSICPCLWFSFKVQAKEFQCILMFVFKFNLIFCKSGRVSLGVTFIL